MPIRAQCPAGHAMMVPDHRAGTHLRCPRCGVSLRVPGKPLPPDKMPATSPSGPAQPSTGSLATESSKAVPPKTVPPKTVSSKTESPKAESSMTESSPATPSDPSPSIAPVSAVPPAPPLELGSAKRRTPWQPDPARRAAARNLAFVVSTMALFSLSPAVWELFAIWQSLAPVATPPWVYLVLFSGALQLAYAVYLAQIPDWSALWATTTALLAASAGYALMLGTTLMGKQESTLVVLLRYADKLPGNRAAMWCFVMLCFTSVLTYFLGLTAARWYRAYQLTRKVHEKVTSG